MFTYATTLCHPAPTETPIHNHIINWSVLKSMHCSRINHSLLCQKKKKGINRSNYNKSECKDYQRAQVGHCSTTWRLKAKVTNPQLLQPPLGLE